MPRQNVIALLCTAPSQYVHKAVHSTFTQPTIDCLTTNNNRNGLHNEMVILNYIGDELINHSLRINHLSTYCKGTVHQKG